MRVLAEGDAPVSPFLNTARAKEIAGRDLASNPLGYARYGIEVVLSLNEWLRRYPVRLHID